MQGWRRFQKCAVSKRSRPRRPTAGLGGRETEADLVCSFHEQQGV